MEDKKIVLKFTIICETDTSMVNGDTYEEKLNNFEHDVENALESEIRHLGDTELSIDCVESHIEDYE